MTDPTASASPPFAAPVERDLVVVHGPDATSFLQSLVSQDLEPIPVGASARSLLLQPQGKLLVDFYVHRAGEDEWWCVCEGGFGGVLADGFNRFKIRVKADVEERPIAALAVRGLAPPPDTGPGLAVVQVAWGGHAAFDLLGTPGEIDAARDQLGLPVVDSDAYERARVEAGVPRLGTDLDDKTIPQEAGLERDAVSFTKGCFVGQELVCRIDTRGHVNRHLRRVRSLSGTALGAGAEVVLADKTVGTVTSAAGDIGLAMLRREVEAGVEVSVDGVPAIVEIEVGADARRVSGGSG